MSNFLTPVLVLIIWTLIMWVWMYATRIPAMKAERVHPDSYKTSVDRETAKKLPNKVVAVADNYNHLHEQPVLFYALMFFAQMSGYESKIMLITAWVYVGLRVIHSLIQATAGKVIIRFAVFALASLTLIFMAGLNVGALIAS